ncbi:membrane protein [Pseudomonas phage ER16]|nr:membrane protein [Pseudomonas phage ER16]
MAFAPILKQPLTHSGERSWQFRQSQKERNMSSKKVTLNADGTAATVADAKIGDIVTTVFSTDSAVTGMYGLVQKAGLVAAGMTVNSYRLRGSFNPIVAR